MIICVVLHNITHKLRVIKHYNELKIQAVNTEIEEKGALIGVWEIIGTVRWYGIGLMIVYVVSLSIFPGYITEDVHSEILGDWYPIILIAAYNVFDLVGKCLTSIYVVGNLKLAIGASFARLLFFPVYLACLHGPMFLRTEITVTTVTSLLGLTNGYLISCFLILAPKTVPLQQAETAGNVLVLFMVLGLASGSVVSWFWVI
ncbi:hypothetical protein L1887_25353 [Cichorium endivia]|nr:hypothetical protein L1887_25353 [Cichorium endivia]